MSGPPLASLLAEEVACLRDFLALLETEQQLLVAGEADRLLPLAEEKNRLFQQLDRLGEARAAALAALGLPAGGEGMAAWLGGEEAARDTWQALLALAARARALNETNGRLIAERLAHNRQALAVLLAAADQAALYGPDGQPRPLGGGRSLGSV